MFMHIVLVTVPEVLAEIWALLLDASIYIVIGLLAGGMLKVFLSPGYVAAHLGTGRFGSVVKAALLGVPLPLCSCGVLPAAAALKKQGASNGATTAFLISTPESGVDSIAISWVLLDPLMTVFRPLAAFITALVAGTSENLLHPPRHTAATARPVVAAGDAEEQVSSLAGGGLRRFASRVRTGVRYALVELWGDLVWPLLIGLLFAGIVAVLVPDDFFQAYLGGGISSMLVMLAFGIPLYICATASTPIAAALILKGVSPGAVLVFLLVGPATNVATITVLTKMLGKRSTALYLVSIAVVSVLCGLTLDQIYSVLGISAKAAVGKAAEVAPEWLQNVATFLLLLLSVRPLVRKTGCWFGPREKGCACPSPQVQSPLSMAGNDVSACGDGCQCGVPAAPLRKGIRQASSPE
ncbi:MAG: SO_0444 family Cu/Zn efflux transporter [Desulfobulbaceae bacterium]